MSRADALQQTDRVDGQALRAFIERKWTEEIVPALTEYIKVPAKSPAFDAGWAKHGYIDRVVSDAARWAEQQRVQGLKLEVVRPGHPQPPQPA